MKKIFGLFLVAFMAMGMCFADPVEGYWISYDEKSGEATAGWEIKAQDGKLFGGIIRKPMMDATIRMVNEQEISVILGEDNSNSLNLTHLLISYSSTRYKGLINSMLS
mgnify:CR=1 FL=1